MIETMVSDLKVCSNTQKLEFPRTTVHNLTLLTSDGNLLTRFYD